MKRNAERLRMLSEQILSTSKVNREERLAVSEGNLSDLVNCVVDNFGLPLEEYRTEPKFRWDNGLLRRRKSGKILSSLISNAIKCRKEGV